MTLSEEAVRSFGEIYFEQFGEKLSDSEADEKAVKLLRLFKLIYRPVPENWKAELKRKYEKSK